MKTIIVILIALLILSCEINQDPAEKIDPKEIIDESIKVHDPFNNWDSLAVSLQIQEPRIKNFSRYSEVTLDMAGGSFMLVRNRGPHTSTHIIDKAGQPKLLFNGNEEIEQNFIEKYRLHEDRNMGYKRFYEMLLGLPMTLTEKNISSYEKIEEQMYNKETCYKIHVTLDEALFSKHWILFINKKTFIYEGMEIVFPEDSTKGERLLFDGNIKINGINIPRFRHWYNYSDNKYAGSDIILKEID